jgi:hypothetical protein
MSCAAVRGDGDNPLKRAARRVFGYPYSTDEPGDTALDEIRDQWRREAANKASGTPGDPEDDATPAEWKKP